VPSKVTACRIAVNMDHITVNMIVNLLSLYETDDLFRLNFNYACVSCFGAVYFMNQLLRLNINVHALISVTAVGGCDVVVSSRSRLNVSCSQAPIAATL
jgi:hypothetical protein